MSSEPVPVSRGDLPSSAKKRPGFSVSPLPDFVVTFFFLILTTALLVAIKMRGGDISLALKDPASLTDRPVYLGAISNAGVMFLVVSGTATMMAFVAGAKDARLFVSVSLFTLILAVDDLFLLHEGPIRDALPWFEVFVFGMYGFAAVLILHKMRGSFLRPRQMPLLMAVFLMSLSVVLDTLVDGVPGKSVVEDLSKFAGFLLWSVYWSRRSVEAVRVKS